MPTKKYRIQTVWIDIDGKLQSVSGEIEWDKENKATRPLFIHTDGSKIEIEPERLKKVDNGDIDYVYETPGFKPPPRDKI